MRSCGRHVLGPRRCAGAGRARPAPSIAASVPTANRPWPAGRPPVACRGSEQAVRGYAEGALDSRAAKAVTAMDLPLVAGVDGSDSSLTAVDWAVDEAARHGL
ncbi:universal stress protein, partial [Streptomyces tricolor]